MADPVEVMVLASQRGWTEQVRRLIADGGDVNGKASDGFGTTPLIMAADGGHAEIAQLLIHAGADTAAKIKGGFTPLSMAARAGKHAVVQVLLDAGADVSPLDDAKSTPLHSAAQEGHATVARLLLQWAPLELEIGRAVRLKGLVSRADINGERGHVTGFTPETSRFGVRLKSGQNLAVISSRRVFLRNTILVYLKG
ncbi:ankyrin repeat-containing domain protein [Baffinella frigidus]|nr:ankyrin repeat-containing domain protein [Cryptophyta sp. CCMP2293]